MYFIILVFIIAILRFYFNKTRYDRSTYKKESGKRYDSVRFDKGNYGEYLTFEKLDKVKGKHKILTNIYVPKANGETTEIDLVFIHETGIYVIESKNYSGWIFGNEKSKFWTQTFKTGKKQSFYNPIWQNNTHVKYLIKLLSTIDSKCFKSIIVFSERCTLKKIDVFSENIRVINRYNLNNVVEKFINVSQIVFTEEKINEIYLTLKQYTQVSDDIKQNHINRTKQLKI